MKYSVLILCGTLGLSSCISKQDVKTLAEIENHKTPYEIVDEAPTSDWRDLDQEYSLYIKLESGMVVVELAKDYAPNHVENTKALAREGVFDNTSFYRVIDGFVAQGGPMNPEKLTKPKNGKLSIEAEFSIKTEKPFDITPIGEIDGYADETGFYNGFAVGRSADKKDNWLLHCYGAFAMGRANDVNSGGTELYAVIGNAQRYLDKNTTVFGRVVAGMEHLQALKRSSGLNGSVDVTNENKIISIQVGSDLNESEQLQLQIMDTASQSFKDLIQSRKNRRGEWFVDAKNYIDACSVPVPSRLKSNQ
ncbi:MAG: peptidylprolyl isomerase [Xanthomonadales bacterium]|nr:peptidylprolyl isomerase [Xanthomonadales bacterium]